MRDILAQTNRDVLAQFAWSNLLVAFDFDGTLAPIVDDPASARMRPMTRRLLAMVAGRYPTVVISGRTQRDLRARLSSIALARVIGHHGIEPGHTPGRFESAVHRWLPRLRERLAACQGVRIEDKTFSVAIHYRLSRRKRRARAAILEAIADLGATRVLAGKDVINVLPERALHKGFALERERARLGCDTALYVGDDQGDEDVFALDRLGRLLTIRVGFSRKSLANYGVQHQLGIDTPLRCLSDLRASSLALGTAQG